MSKEHWILLAAFLAAVGLQIGTLEHWREGTTPQFIGGVLAQLAIVVRAIHTERPA